MPVDTGLDPEVLAEIRSTLNEFVDKRFADFDTKTERRMKELSARGLGPGYAATASGLRSLLADDTKFREFLGKGRVGVYSKYSASYPDFHLEHKAIVTSPALKVQAPGVSAPPEVALRLVELLPVVSLTSGGLVEYVRETGFTPNADLQLLEGDVKAASDITFAPATASIKTIATTIKASLQALADTPGLHGWLDARLRYAVQLKAEDHLLNAAAPDGLLAAAGAVDPAFAPAAGATALDTIGGAIAQLSAAGYTPDGVVMNGADVHKMKLLKDGNDRYLWASPNSSMGTSSVWSLPLVISPSMAAGSWLVGAFSQAAVLFLRQMLVVDIAYENEDDFLRNLACFRAEERIGSAIPIPAGLVKGTFTPATAMAASRK